MIKSKKHKLKGDAISRSVFLDGEYLSPAESQIVCNHSPDGFSWGYGGSGAAQLALAIILKLTTKHEGYQVFKWRVIAKLPQEKSFEIEFEL
ncbi:MAG TPA: hypothetical protein ENH41_03390 [Candidatus Omnitrophica bacterium]|nr:hypothetical protein [Candidatus Omnitrophota bacterium]